jgi:(p)ppGpp synthase/HD superfamily hydrolase
MTTFNEEDERRIAEAAAFAKEAHGSIDQRRKYTNEPYIVHPAEVASIVRTVGSATVEMVMAAWLHDVVEDTPHTIGDITERFGPGVSALVGWLTDISVPEDGNRAHRKNMDLEHSGAAPAAAQTVKYADLIANTGSITQHDEDFAEVYMKEKARLLDVMNKGDTGLRQRALGLAKSWEDNKVQRALGKMGG